MEWKAYFDYTRNQRIGLLLLVGVILLIQILYLTLDFSKPERVSQEEKEWLALQSQIDTLKNTHEEDGYKIYPFNPNFITDYKGYKLGMSVAEIDRLLAFRKTGKFINSADEFQKVTIVSDALLQKIAPFFKFPDWVNQRKPTNLQYAFVNYKYENKKDKPIEKIEIKDINQATKEDLVKVFGIGEVISERILKSREALGGFVAMDQLKDVWGLSPEVVLALNERFAVKTMPVISKVEINNASTKELMKVPYIRYGLAREIILYRSMNGAFQSVDELVKIKGFPVEKLKIIALYLDLKQ
ncbi:ComEA family DNA-binding protein [Flavobacterium sp.]|uniref:ComEA family DNA-binding protein n=1 Tax=Flavobacterium sp. TaxID=239 RepID=UPI003D14A3C3